MAYIKKEYEILVIEDNLGDFTLIEGFLLEQLESSIIINAVNYKQAIELLSKGNNSFDIVILDLSLPDKGGVPLITETIKLCPGIPVIVLTGYADFAYGVQSLSLGVSDYLLKDELTASSLYKSIVYSLERKSTIISLEESEKKYSELFHLCPLPMWVFDIDSLKFLDVNAPAIKHYGFSRKEFLSMTIEDIAGINNSDSNTLPLKDGEDRIQIHTKKDGGDIQVDIITNKIEYKGKKAKIMLVNDITERSKQLKINEDQTEKLKQVSYELLKLVNKPIAATTNILKNINSLSGPEKELQTAIANLTAINTQIKAIIKKISL